MIEIQRHAPGGGLSQNARQQVLDYKAKYPQARSALLPALHVLQDDQGFVTAQGMVEVADLLGINPADVEQVATFYSMYHRAPVGQYTVRVCVSTPCWLRGCDELVENLKARLGVEIGGTSADGKITLEHIECLAACGSAPVVQVNDEYGYDITPDKADALIELLRTSDTNPFYVP